MSKIAWGRKLAFFGRSETKFGHFSPYVGKNSDIPVMSKSRSDISIPTSREIVRDPYSSSRHVRRRMSGNHAEMLDKTTMTDLLVSRSEQSEQGVSQARWSPEACLKFCRWLTPTSTRAYVNAKTLSPSHHLITPLLFSLKKHEEHSLALSRFKLLTDCLGVLSAVLLFFHLSHCKRKRSWYGLRRRFYQLWSSGGHVYASY